MQPETIPPMNFRKPGRDEPEINLIPFIDVLLVVLIFLVLTTTFSRHTELQLVLPAADSQAASVPPRELAIAVDAEGRYAVTGRLLDDATLATLVDSIERAAQALGAGQQPVVRISADARASHQAVVKAMDAARRCGLQRIAFAAQKPGA